MSKTVQLTLPDHVWGRLASMADTNGLSVADLVGDAVENLLEPTARERREYKRVVVPTDSLALLDFELSAARRAGWRAPIRGRRVGYEKRSK